MSSDTSLFCKDTSYDDLVEDDGLELYFRGPDPILERFGSGSLTTSIIMPAASDWTTSRSFLLPGRFGLQGNTQYEVPVPL